MFVFALVVLQDGSRDQQGAHAAQGQRKVRHLRQRQGEGLGHWAEANSAAPGAGVKKEALTDVPKKLVPKGW